jgi:predicted membrane channel-forming protein YqfA (hemolysin III family)
MNLMKLRFLAMGCIFIILSIVLLFRRYSVDDFGLTVLGIILLAIGAVWKNTETKKKPAPPSDTNQI